MQHKTIQCNNVMQRNTMQYDAIQQVITKQCNATTQSMQHKIQQINKMQHNMTTQHFTVWQHNAITTAVQHTILTLTTTDNSFFYVSRWWVLCGCGLGLCGSLWWVMELPQLHHHHHANYHCDSPPPQPRPPLQRRRSITFLSFLTRTRARETAWASQGVHFGGDRSVTWHVPW